MSLTRKQELAATYKSCVDLAQRGYSREAIEDKLGLDLHSIMQYRKNNKRFREKFDEATAYALDNRIVPSEPVKQALKPWQVDEINQEWLCLYRRGVRLSDASQHMGCTMGQAAIAFARMSDGLAAIAG